MNKYQHEEICDYTNNSSALCNCILSDPLEEIKELEQTLKDLQSQCGYASPWWVKIEGVINPENPALKELWDEKFTC